MARSKRSGGSLVASEALFPTLKGVPHHTEQLLARLAAPEFWSPLFPH